MVARPAGISRRLVLTAFLAAAAGVALVHGRSLNHDFVYDDAWTIVRNPALGSVLPPGRFFRDASTFAAPETGMGSTVYRPLPTLSFALNRAAAGRRTWAWRLPDLLLHALNGALVFLALIALLGLSPEAAALGAALFLFHPAQVESVVWVTQRSNLLCAAAGLSALLLAARGSLWGLAAYAAALLSKETAAALAPFLVLAAVSSGADPRRKKALWTGAVVLTAAYALLRGAVAGGFAQRGWRGGFAENILVGQASWLEYLRLSAWPARLTASHAQYLGNPWEHPAPWIGALLAAAWAAGIFFAWKRGARRAALGGAWVPVLLAPHLGLLPLDTFVAERFLYLPMAGWAALAALAWDALPPRASRALALLPLAFALLSFKRTAAWRNDETLWRAAVRAEPDNAFARLALADAFYARGRREEAAQATREGLTRNPSAPLAAAGLCNLSDDALTGGRPAAALRFADAALRAGPGSPPALRNRERALAALGRR